MPHEKTVSSGTLTPMLRAADDPGNDAYATEIHEDDPRFAWVMPDQSDYACPPEGTKARFRLSGISKEFKLPSRFHEEPTDNIRIEFQLVKIATPKLQYLEGKRFTALYTPKISPRSNLGQLLGRLRGRDVEPQESIDYDLFIGTDFIAMSELTANGNYANISPKAIELGKTRLSPFLNGVASEPVTASAEDDDNPFAEEDL